MHTLNHPTPRNPASSRTAERTVLQRLGFWRPPVDARRQQPQPAHDLRDLDQRVRETGEW